MNNDELDRLLNELPVHDTTPPLGQRVRRRALAALAKERRLASRPWQRRAAHLWNGTVEPILAAGAVAVYLAWLVEVLLLLH